MAKAVPRISRNILRCNLSVFIENYREELKEREDLVQVLDGLIFELEYLAERGSIHQAAIEDNIAAWNNSSEEGVMAVPGFYRVPGSPLPPSSAWQSAVATGIVGDVPAALRLEIGYFYEEFIGIHNNYLRVTEFTERELLPTAIKGEEFFYDSNGKLLPDYTIHMQLQLEFASDLDKLLQNATDLADRLKEIRLQQ